MVGNGGISKFGAGGVFSTSTLVKGARMAGLKRVLAVILGFCAAAVAGQFVLSPLYADRGNAALGVWYYLDFLMAVSLVVALVWQWQGKGAAAAGGRDDGVLSRERLAANALFYATLLVALWFFRNWLDFLTSNPLGSQSVATMMVWDLVDGLLPIVLGITALRVWRAAKAEGRGE